MRRLILAAERGDAGAQFNLGVICDNNLDDNHRSRGDNRAEAIGWLRRAARQGLPRAQNKLAELYAKGPDAPKRDVVAYAWFTLAAKSSTGAQRQKAESGYGRIASRMSAEQVSKALTLVRNWVARPQDVAPAIAGRFPQRTSR